MKRGQSQVILVKDVVNFNYSIKKFIKVDFNFIVQNSLLDYEFENNLYFRIL